MLVQDSVLEDISESNYNLYSGVDFERSAILFPQTYRDPH